MRVMVFSPWSNAEEWLRRLRAAAPELEFVLWPEIGRAEAIDAAVVWQPPPGLLEGLPNLRCICALGAGVDDLFAPGLRLPDVPIVRIADPVMAERMASWVLAAVLHWQRDFHLYLAQQREQRWSKHAHPDLGEVRIGIMGLGVMGRAAAEMLARVGFAVAGWSRSPKAVSGIESFAGEADRRRFLARSDYLVCLLPLTPQTRGILNAKTFAALPEGAVVINAGRGEHVVEADLLAALESDRLRGAVLDVFVPEPLPPDHPFWAHPKIVVTPHVASITNPATGAAQIADALRAVRDGREPANLVDRERGY